MLKRLELIGFKSFADRTVFDFAPGITAVVGPNGSGKSNIVDALRWLLGEQSAKSLRGSELTDVIFNGSTTRKSLGLAEVTMTFDNAERLLPMDQNEVDITRRVYRDGQGEYLINGQIVRLKDIKELFLGTGAGHGAYSVIEQGRVDALLSASTKDRRMIFEEAAGISRFRAKKIETQRKLERVDADLLRIQDILQELEKQLKTLRQQAGKATEYQELTERLKQLRVGQSLLAYQQIAQSLADEHAELARLQGEVFDTTRQTEEREAELTRLAEAIHRHDQQLRETLSRQSSAKQRIATSRATIDAESAQFQRLQLERRRLGRQRIELFQQIRGLESTHTLLQQQLAEVTTTHAERQTEAERAKQELDAANRSIVEIQQQVQTDRAAQFDLVSQVAKWESDTATYRSQAERLTVECQRKLAAIEQARLRHANTSELLDTLSHSNSDVRQRLDRLNIELQGSLQQRRAARQQLEQLQRELETVREKRSALRGRCDILEALEQSFEGFGAGVRLVHEHLQDGVTPWCQSIVGMVADLLRVPRELAPLIDLALGETTQSFVVRAEAMPIVVEGLNSIELPGRVGLVPLQSWRLVDASPQLPGRLRASSLVQCTIAEMDDLRHQLLDSVWIVDDLDQAWSIAQTDDRQRIVTRTGMLLEPDGRLSVGPTEMNTGLLSRKSELHELTQQLAALNQRLTHLETEQTALRATDNALSPTIEAVEAEVSALSGEAGTLRDQILEQRQRLNHHAEHLELLQSEHRQMDQERDRCSTAWHDAERRANAATAQTEAVKVRLANADSALSVAERNRDERVQCHTDARVRLSQIAEQRTSLQHKLDENTSALRQRRSESVNLTTMQQTQQAEQTRSTLTILQATAHAADAYHDKDTLEQRIRTLSVELQQKRAKQSALTEALKQSRDVGQRQQGVTHERELAIRDLANRQEALVQRIRDDYALELSELAERPDDTVIPLSLADDQNPEQEIDRLRKKINKLGSVNLDALAELNDVEQREGELRKQYNDLTGSRQKLRAIIDQINTDSRKLFGETLESIRAHFQVLFRKLFAGGAADIILDNDADILEAGIDISARPPGKETQRISLLSGGERALTAVALLLAIFQSKPSPFCLLDEVDAAMDEANTQRLAGLLREFAERSQFIVITHKKRTMAVADMLHGVTMQESGVSKMIAVRFEDWPDDDAKPRIAA